jgi:hypothetical protein
MLPFVRRRDYDQDTQLHSTSASGRWGILPWVGHHERVLQHAPMPSRRRLVGVGRRNMHHDVRRRGHDEDTQLHSTNASERWSRLPWVGHRASGLQYAAMPYVVGVGCFRAVLPNLRRRDED